VNRPRPLFMGASLFTLALSVLVVASASAQTTTVTLDFDQPDYTVGTALQTEGDITFLHGAEVFQPSHVMTFSGTQALKLPTPCANALCSNGAYLMEIRFGNPLPLTPNGFLWRRASSVSLRVGADVIATGCFPEGTDCSMYAYLTGLDDKGTIVARSDDVLLFNAGSVGGLNANIDKEIRVDDAAARIVRVVLVYGKSTFSHDPIIPYPGEPQIDHLVVSFPDSPPALPPLPAGPTLTITAPNSGNTVSQPYLLRLQGSVTASGKPAAFCYFLNATTPVTAAGDCHDGASLKSDNTFDILIDAAKLKAGANTLSATIFDLWGQRGGQSVSFTTQAPFPPVVTIWQPADLQWLSPSGPPFLSGSVYTTGELAGFCALVEATTIPTLQDCQQNLAEIPYRGYEPLNYALSVPQASLRSGLNRLTVFAIDRWGQIGRADVSVNLPTDFRVVAMEISQGIQNADIPMNINGAAQYLGVRLRSGVPTVVRVFANSPFTGNYCCATMTLRGFVPNVQAGELSLGILQPDSNPSALSNGNIDVPLSVRADPVGGYVFTLPNAWTMQSGLRLLANLVPQAPLQECVSCAGNNSFSVFGINFEQAASFVVNPVELIFTDGAGVIQRPPPSIVAFGPVRNLSPVTASSAIIRPYVATVDVTDLVNSTGGCRAINNTCEDAVFGRVTASQSTQPGNTVGVGPIDVGVEKPVSFYRFPDIVIEPMAVSNSARPFTSVGHEFYHELGYYHASPGCPPVDFFNLWPPDQLGFIHGFGLDRRQNHGSTGVWNGQYTILAPGAVANPPQYFDLMSYCADDTNAWISVENWNSFGGAFPNGVIPDSIFVGNSTTTITQGSRTMPEEAQQVKGGALRLSAVVSKKGSIDFFRVDRVEGWILAHAHKSQYVFAVFGADGKVLSRTPAMVVPPRGHTSVGTTLAALVPALGAETIRIEHDGEVIGEKRRSPSSPVVEIKSPDRRGSVSRDGALKVAWMANDEDNDTLEAKIEYSPSPRQAFRSLYIGPNRGEWMVPGNLFTVSSKGRLKVAVSDGFNETESRTIVITVIAAPPLLDIIAPEPGTTFPISTPIRLQGAAFGDGGEPLSEKQIEWLVDDASVGLGAEVELTNLKPGSHVAKIIAREGKLTSTREVAFAIGQNR
jgi:hypothetical protein